MENIGPKKRRSIREEFTNLPNMLTMGRICLIPPVLALMLTETRLTNLLAAVLFGVAAITDWLDGYLARKRGLESVLGKLLDPLADKLIVMSTLVIAAQLHHIPGWFVALLLAREMAIGGLRSIAGQEGLMIDVVPAGKWKTALQLIGLVGIIIHYPYCIDFLFVEAVVHFNGLGLGLLALSMIFSLVSAVIYFTRFLKAIKAQKESVIEEEQ
jgi:CDP-diacylglycerol--glycerol-3-phosphate 3-phosphatidyltransferase